MDDSSERETAGGMGATVAFILLFTTCCFVAVFPALPVGRGLLDIIPWMHPPGGWLVLAMLFALIFLLPEVVAPRGVPLFWRIGPVILTFVPVLVHDILFSVTLLGVIPLARQIGLALNVAVAARGVVWRPGVASIMNLGVATYVLLITAAALTHVYRDVGMFTGAAA